MNNTNVEYYIAGFDADGKRVGSSICEFDPKKSKNVNKLDELKKRSERSVCRCDCYRDYLSRGF